MIFKLEESPHLYAMCDITEKTDSHCLSGGGNI